MNKIPYNLSDGYAKDMLRNNKILDFIDSEHSLCSGTLDSMSDILHNAGVKTFDTYFDQLKMLTNPEYYPFTNKKVLKSVIQDGGLNIQEGLQKWIQDIKKNNMPTLSKIDAINLGDNIAPSKGDVIYENNIIELIHYKPLCRDIYQQPLLIVPPWINKYYILDLNKEKSFVQYCLKKGMDVFIISWKSATHKDVNIGMDDYIIKGVEKSISIINKPLHVLGFCVGGIGTIISSIRNKDRKIQSVSLLATPIDFSHLHKMKQFITNTNFSTYVDKMLSQGYQSGDDLFKMFCFLKAEGLILKNIVEQYYLNKTPIENDILYWNMDSINIPAKLHLEYLEKFLLKNQLIKGRYMMEGEFLHIQNLILPTFIVAAEKDHIVPPASSFALRTGGDNVEYILGGSGHIGGIINPPEQKKYYFSTYCPKQKKLVKQNGSWWDTWSVWVTKQMGVKKKLENDSRFSKIRKAPGKHVLDQTNLNKYCV